MYKNFQWHVTEHGLEVKDNLRREYFIPAAMLVETHDDTGGPVYSVLVDLALKTWVIPELLFEAYEQALIIHAERLPRPVDPDTWERSKSIFWGDVSKRRTAPKRQPGQTTA